MNMENQYLEHMLDIIEIGAVKENRTGIKTRSIFGHQMTTDLREGFPLLTTKKMFTKGIIHELLWLLSGDTNIKYLLDNDVHIWDEWADENGDLGPVYGAQWRNWQRGDEIENQVLGPVDQIANAIKTLKTNPDCRRNIVTAWNPGEIEQMALPPCHMFFQFNTEEIPENELNALPKGTRYLDCLMYQRSADWFLGVPFNIASYSLLTMMVAQVVGMVPRNFTHTFGDSHIYENHLGACHEQLSNYPMPVPIMLIHDRGQSIDEFLFEDFLLGDYECHPAIKAEVAV